MNFYKRDIGDYQKKTGHLSLLEHGAYCMLLDHHYATRRPLPMELADVYRLVRAMTPTERKAVQSVLHQFFTHTTDGWTNQRAIEVIEQYEANAATNRQIAQNRETKRRTNRGTKRSTDLPETVEPNPEPRSINTHHPPSLVGMDPPENGGVGESEDSWERVVEAWQPKTRSNPELIAPFKEWARTKMRKRNPGALDSGWVTFRRRYA